jgi:uncharacterized protein YggT (Ycf19 family)
MAMGFVHLFVQVLSGIVLVDAISSWVVKDPSAFPRSITGAITRPLYAPFRAIVKPEALGGVDISPLLVIVSLNLLAQALGRLMM